MRPTRDDDPILAIGRPHPSRWTYFWLTCLVIPPLFLVVAPHYWFR